MSENASAARLYELYSQPRKRSKYAWPRKRSKYVQYGRARQQVIRWPRKRSKCSKYVWPRKRSKYVHYGCASRTKAWASRWQPGGARGPVPRAEGKSNCCENSCAMHAMHIIVGMAWHGTAWHSISVGMAWHGKAQGHDTAIDKKKTYKPL